MFINSTKKSIPSEINTLDELHTLITDNNIILNLNKFTPQVNKKLLDILNCSSMTYTELTRKIKSVFSAQSTAQLEYWKLRGWDNPTECVSRTQSAKSIYTVEYWVNRGYNVSSAKLEISKIQQQLSKKSNGVSKEELRKRSIRCIEYWINKGYSIEDARLEVKRVNDNSSKEYYINRYGLTTGVFKYNQACKSKAVFGKDNPQYGKPAPIGSGNGISGYYKEYYFRSLYEYYAIKHFEKNNVKFICNDVCKSKLNSKVIIKYIDDNGIIRNYTPDFIVNDTIITEVKSSYQLDNSTVIKKKDATELFIKKSNIYNKYDILTECDFNIDINTLRLDYQSNIVKIDSGKLNRFKKHIGIL
jgi:hypothetical protein